MRKFTLILLIGVMVILLAACGSSKDKNDANHTPSASIGSNATKTGLDALKEKGEFTIAATGAYPPYAYHAIAGDRDLTGFDVELLKEIFNRIGNIKVIFKETEWDGMLAGLDAGRFDSIHQIGVTEERKQKYDFPDPYLVAYPTLIVLDRTDDIKSFDDLKGKKVYGSSTSIYGKIAESKGAVLVPEGEAIELLTTKRVDAIIFNNLYYLDLKKTRPDLKIKAVDQLKDEEQVALPLLKGSDGTVIKAFNQALQEVKQDGTYGKLSLKWFGKDLTQ